QRPIEVPRSRSQSITLLYSAAVRLQARSVRRRGLSFRFSGGFAGPGESTTVQLSGPYGVSAFVGVQDRPHVSRVVVSKALARSTSSPLGDLRGIGSGNRVLSGQV